MVTTRIPPEAFDFYVGLGPERSYRQVGERYGVSKRAITKLAVREDWAARLQKIEHEARERSDAKLTETVEEMRTRHLTLLKAMSARVVTALREFPLNSGMETNKRTACRYSTNAFSSSGISTDVNAATSNGSPISGNPAMR